MKGEEEDYDDETDKLVKQSLYGKKEEDENPKDYKSYLKTLSQKDLRDEMDAALEAGDFDKCGIIQPFLEGQSKDLYRRELRIINERLNLHTK